MHTDTTGMTTIERLKAETRDYLDSEHNNQIRGFYHFDGYWTKKAKAMEDLDADRREHLEELYAYMCGITIDDLETWTRESGMQQLKYWKYAGVGRVSDGRKQALRHAAARASGSIVQNNWKILQRVRWHVGATLRRNIAGKVYTALADTEVMQHVEDVASSELNSTFWSDEGSRFSNAIFRLEICKSWLAGTEHERIINERLAGVSRAWLLFKDVPIGTGIIEDNYTETIRRANEQIEEHEQAIKSSQTSIDSHKEHISDLRRTKRDANRDLDGMSLSLAMKLKGFVKAVS